PGFLPLCRPGDSPVGRVGDESKAAAGHLLGGRPRMIDITAGGPRWYVVGVPDVLSVDVAHHYWFGHFNDSQTDCHRSDVDDRGSLGGPQAAVVIVLPFLGLFVLADFATPELFAGRGEDHPMPSRFESVEKIVGESERLIETGFRSRDIYQQPLIGIEIIALVDR